MSQPDHEWYVLPTVTTENARDILTSLREATAPHLRYIAATNFIEASLASGDVADISHAFATGTIKADALVAIAETVAHGVLAGQAQS